MGRVSRGTSTGCMALTMHAETALSEYRLQAFHMQVATKCCARQVLVILLACPCADSDLDHHADSAKQLWTREHVTSVGHPWPHCKGSDSGVHVVRSYSMLQLCGKRRSPGARSLHCLAERDEKLTLVRAGAGRGRPPGQSFQS